MQALIIIFAGIFGLIMGSFLNVIILRINTGRGIGGRSACLSCGRTLGSGELVPLISFFIQKGKCKHCRSAISLQYPLVEAATAVLFAGVMFRYVHLLFQGAILSFVLSVLFWFLLVSIGMVISAYDFRHKIIHIHSLIAFLVLCAIGGVFGGVVGSEFIIPTGGLSIVPQIIGAIAVPLPFFILWLVSEGRLMGLGDIEIMAGMGFLFGVIGGYSAVTLAFWIGTAVVCLFILTRSFVRNKMPLDRAIPFAPFLLAGVYLVGVFGLDVFAIILGLR